MGGYLYVSSVSPTRCVLVCCLVWVLGLLVLLGPGQVCNIFCLMWFVCMRIRSVGCFSGARRMGLEMPWCCELALVPPSYVQ